MADITILAPFIRRWEGGFVDDPDDRGGATNMGVTLATWQKCGYDKNHDGHIDATDIKLLSPDDFNYVLKRYWDTWKADQIKNQSIANILVDWVYLSGRWGIVIPQGLLLLKKDGIVGVNTIAALNGQDPETLFRMIYNARVNFINGIVRKNPAQRKFYNGWTLRLSKLKFS
jgi:lysozyme family protein